MGTKDNPGDFDCYAKAAPDEPLFTLLARDPLAPAVVEAWADARHTDALMRGNLADQKVIEAYQCAASMRQWRIAKKGRTTHERPAMNNESQKLEPLNTREVAAHLYRLSKFILSAAFAADALLDDERASKLAIEAGDITELANRLHGMKANIRS